MKHDHSNYLHVGINSALLSGPQAQMVENNRRNIPLGATLKIRTRKELTSSLVDLHPPHLTHSSTTVLVDLRPSVYYYFCL